MVKISLNLIGKTLEMPVNKGKIKFLVSEIEERNTEMQVRQDETGQAYAEMRQGQDETLQGQDEMRQGLIETSERRDEIAQG